MKLIRFGEPHREKPGIDIEGIRFDCSKYFKDWDHEFFQTGGLKKLEDLLQNGTLNSIPEHYRWANPIARPNMIICVGLNYSDHAKESGMETPSEPVLFMKASNTISGPHDPITIPPDSTKTDWEIELGIVISQDIYRLESEAEAMEAIAGYTLINDVSEREFQLEKSGQWVKGKSCPGFTPTGPYLVTKDEIEDVLNLDMKLSVNEEVRQSGNTKTMIFHPGFIVHYISQFMKLEAGDLISTGTPPGVGLGMDPPVYLTAGDRVDLEIEGLGSQTHLFKAYKK